MPVIDVQQDIQNRTLTMVSQFAAPVERVWQVWSDPRQLERWWGPPGFPATVTEHELTPGGTVRYHMTGPDGQKYAGYWRVGTVEPPALLEFEDGFADADGNPVDSAPVGRARIELTAHEGGTRMTSTTVYATAEDLQKVLDMGAVEGTKQAVAQIDDLLRA